MRIVMTLLLAAALGCCGSDGGSCPSGIGQDCTADLAMPDMAHADLRCAADLAGTPRQICGMPDASFSPSLCACAGDP